MTNQNQPQTGRAARQAQRARRGASRRGPLNSGGNKSQNRKGASQQFSPSPLTIVSHAGAIAVGRGSPMDSLNSSSGSLSMYSSIDSASSQTFMSDLSSSIGSSIDYQAASFESHGHVHSAACLATTPHGKSIGLSLHSNSSPSRGSSSLYLRRRTSGGSQNSSPASSRKSLMSEAGEVPTLSGANNSSDSGKNSTSSIPSLVSSTPDAYMPNYDEFTLHAATTRVPCDRSGSPYVVIWLTGEPLVPMKYPTLKQVLANPGTFPSLTRKIKVASIMLNSASRRHVGPVSVAPAASERPTYPELSDPEWLAFVDSLPQGLYQEKTFFEWTVTMEGDKYIHHRIERRALTCLDVEELLALQDLSRTELCHFWEKDGVCPYVVECRFSHGIHDLRPVLRHPKYKTKLCNQFCETGRCQYGIRCRFVHSCCPSALESPTMITEEIAKPIPHYTPPPTPTVLTEAETALVAAEEAAKAAAEEAARVREAEQACINAGENCPPLSDCCHTTTTPSDVPPTPPGLAVPLFSGPTSLATAVPAGQPSPRKDLWSLPGIALAPWEAPASPRIAQSRLFSMFSDSIASPTAAAAGALPCTPETDANMDNSMMAMLGVGASPKASIW